jgi:PAS domain S-box-containing protein
LRPRRIAAVVLILTLTIGAAIVARALTVRDARRDSDRRVELAAAQIRDRIEQGVALTSSLGRYMLDAGSLGVTSPQFTTNALRWLNPAEFPAAAWAEEVRAGDRAAYERRIGQPIVSLDALHTPAPPARSYLPATLVSGFSPLALRGIDLRREPGVAVALRRAITPGGVAATPVTRASDRSAGLFLVAPAPNLIDGLLRPGAVVVFLPEATLRASTSNPPGLRLVSSSRSAAKTGGADTVRKSFFAAAQEFTVVMPKEAVVGPDAALPWIILAAGLVLSALAAVLGVIAGRRAKAQAEVDRIFTLSSDLIAVADFEGRFIRVNPAVDQILGYTQEEFLSKPYLELVHPDDRERTAAEAAAIARGKRTVSFENRYIHRDGTVKVLDWTATPVVADGLMYGVARDVTDRRLAEVELERLAGEQAGLRRVAELVAREAPQAEVFAQVADEVATLVGPADCSVFRDEGDGTATVVAVTGRTLSSGVEPGTRFSLDGDGVIATVIREGRPHRVADTAATSGSIVAQARRVGMRSAVGCPVIVRGRVWGVIGAGRYEPDGFPPDTEERLTRFAELVAAAIGNAQARGEVERLADEQAALRRVATLVALGAEQGELFAVVTEEVAGLFAQVETSINPTIIRFDPGPEFVLVGFAKPMYALELGSRWGAKDLYVSTRVFRSGKSARVDAEDLDAFGGPDAQLLRRQGIIYQVGSPIVVEGRIWGAMTMNSSNPLPPDTGERLASYTELVATAIANADARAEVVRLAEEQAALRRVATLVAQEASHTDVFAAIAEECGQLLGTDDIGMVRFDADSQLVVASSGALEDAFPVGSRRMLEGQNAASQVYETRSTARIDDYASATGPIAEAARSVGVRSAIGSPIVIEGRLWGALLIGSSADEPLPLDTEKRLAQFSDLVATAIANAEARAEVARLAEEQAALRRVAELVAREAPQSEVFAQVADEVASVVGSADCAVFRDEGDETATVVAVSGRIMPTAIPVGTGVPLEGDGVIVTVMREGRPYRVEEASARRGAIVEGAQRAGVRSAVGCPVFVRGRVWGALGAERYEPHPFPAETETRLGRFAELVATAIGNAQARGEVERLAEEQAALRRLAMQVAAGATPSQVFAAVVEEVGRLLEVDRSFLSRFDSDEKLTALAAWSATGERPGVRLPLEFPVGPLGRLILETSAPVRLEPYPGDPSAEVIEGGFRSAVATPVQVKGRLWGFITVARMDEAGPPPGTETRLRDFTELVATALENAESREAVEQLAAEQAALRRVATLVASAAPPVAVFAAVVEEVGRLLAVDQAFLTRFDADGNVTVLAGWRTNGEPPAVELPFQVPAGPMSIEVAETRGPVRLDPYPGDPNAVNLEGAVRSSVAAPVTVRGNLWGFIAVAELGEEPPPPGTEERLDRFTELVATAIANAESRAAVEQLAAEQAALRRVATLVAEGVSPTLVFDAVTAEMSSVFASDGVLLTRYEGTEEISYVAHRGPDASLVPVGTRVPHEPQSVSGTVWRTRAPARMTSDAASPGTLGGVARILGIRTAVGVPIVVDGRLWGVAIAYWRTEQSPAVDTEERMAKFAQLLDTAVANADSRDQLTASRARLLTAADDARRRVVRDLHDGAQQRLVHSIITLKRAKHALSGGAGEAGALIEEALKQAERGNVELRELAHGILPSVLTGGGLRAGVDTVVARADLPVVVDITDRRFPAEIEASAYFIVAEALTNIAKHANADSARVTVSADDRRLHIEVRDDGVGNANPTGQGLVGLRDRAAALGGQLHLSSPPEGGTLLSATLPLSPGDPENGADRAGEPSPSPQAGYDRDLSSRSRNDG